MIIIVLSASDVYIMSVQLGQIDWKIGSLTETITLNKRFFAGL